jgi:hypothetical protein
MCDPCTMIPKLIRNFLLSRFMPISISSDEGRTDERIAKLAGKGRDSLHKAEAIVEAA